MSFQFNSQLSAPGRWRQKSQVPYITLVSQSLMCTLSPVSLIAMAQNALWCRVQPWGLVAGSDCLCLWRLKLGNDCELLSAVPVFISKPCFAFPFTQQKTSRHLEQWGPTQKDEERCLDSVVIGTSCKASTPSPARPSPVRTFQSCPMALGAPWDVHLAHLG